MSKSKKQNPTAEKAIKEARAEIKKRLESKPAKARKPKAEKKPKRLSAIAAAAQVVGDEPMTVRAMMEQMAARGLWASPAGKTPEATLYAAITREIAAKGKDARFRKVDRGLFAAGSKAAA